MINKIFSEQWPVFDVCVIGAGPVGLAIALELGESGVNVVLVESGTDSGSGDCQDLSSAQIVSTKSHAPMENAIHRSLGGTSNWWGGRCVPFDPIDFKNRSFVVGSEWPIEYVDLKDYIEAASQFLGAGSANYDVSHCKDLVTQGEPLSEFMRDTDTLLASRIERWSSTPKIWDAHKERIARCNNVHLLSGYTCVGFSQEAIDLPISRASILSTHGSSCSPKSIRAKFFVLAGGGVESTRLILNSMRAPDGVKPTGGSFVGKCYMGHPSGKLASIRLKGDPAKTIFGFESDGGVYVRRRLTFPEHLMEKENLLNIVFWLDNPPVKDPSHGSGVLSAACLALSTPIVGRWLAPPAIRERMLAGESVSRRAHLRNCLRSPLSTMAFCIGFVYQRYIATPRIPGFFTRSNNNVYALHYHSEQVPSMDSVIELTDIKDRSGLLTAKINLQWGAQDIDSIIRSHELLDKVLTDAGVGNLTYHYINEELSDAIVDQAIDGYHQMGTLRMGESAEDGVTNADGRVFGVPNLFVSGSSLFRTGGQANPTLSAVALGLRQAKHLFNIVAEGK
jgi:choline dehydrogenase-like flavoprotein